MNIYKNMLLISGTIPRITIRNGDIIVHGNCNGCTARATKNSAHLSIKFTRRW